MDPLTIGSLILGGTSLASQLLGGDGGEYTGEQKGMMDLQRQWAEMMLEQTRKKAALQDQYLPGVLQMVQGFANNQLGQGRNTVGAPGLFEPSLGNTRGGLQNLVAQIAQSGMAGRQPGQGDQREAQAGMDKGLEERVEERRANARRRPSPLDRRAEGEGGESELSEEDAAEVLLTVLRAGSPQKRRR